MIQETIDKDIVFHEIILDDLPCCGNPGEPSLPCKISNILLPQNSEIADIDVSYSDIKSLGSGFNIKPVKKTVPLSIVNDDKVELSKISAFDVNEIFPGKLFTKVGVFIYRGYSILVVRLHPVQCILNTGELFYYPELTVSVTTAENGKNDPLFRGLEKDKKEILNRVDNPINFDTYSIKENNVCNTNSFEDYDLLIITCEEFKEGFEQLKNEHEKNGLIVNIETTENIDDLYQGDDLADKIRKFIKNAYTNNRIEYVLLGGDDDIVPARRIGAETPTLYYFNTIPSDLYYSSLDADWNNPENPYPSNKDMTYQSQGVSITTEGTISGPELNYNDFIKGQSSMQWTVTKKDQTSAKITFNFDPPLDLSDTRWFNFHMKSVRHSGYVVLTLSNVAFHCQDGRKIKNSLYHPWGNGTYAYDYWAIAPILIPRSKNFDYEKVDSVTLTLWKGPEVQVGDPFLIDQIYFCDWLDYYLGEPGENDILAEVNIGRASVGSLNEVNNFVEKTISYMITNKKDPYLQKVLLVGEQTHFGGESEWGGNHLDELIDECWKHGYYTKGIPTLNYQIQKLYERIKRWNKQDLINLINENYSIIIHDGHADENKNMKLEKNDISLLTNDKLSFIYSCGCYSGYFVKEDCIAEYYTIKNMHGAFAGIWNARFGYGEEESTDGPSQRYKREFWDAVFNENILSISKANWDSKYDNLGRIDEEHMRYVFVGLNLFGDPALEFVISENIRPDKPVKTEGSLTGKPHKENTYKFVATDPNNDDIYYYIDWDDGTNSGWQGPYKSSEEIVISHTWSERKTFKIKIKAKDEYGLEGSTLELPISVYYNNPKSTFYNKIMENYEILFKLLKIIFSL